MLPPGRWFPPNHAALQRLLDRLSRAGRRRTAVFDWDDTTIFRCLGTATFRYAVNNLDIRLDPAQLSEVLRGEYGGATHTLDGRPFAGLAAEAVAAWETLWPLVRAGEAPRAIERFPQEHQRFRAIAGAFYPLIEDRVGAPFAYPYLVEILGDREEAEFEALAERAWAATRAEGVQPVVWSAPGEAGPVSVEFEGGIGLYEEMAALARALVAAGVEVHVVTASAEYAIRAGVRLTGFPVPPERVHGVRLVAEGRRLTHRSPTDWPLTYRAGKVEVIRRVLPEEPVLVAGDTNTDFEMLTRFPSTELRLIINREQVGPIASLYGLAGQPSGDGPVTLLQGRDEPQGSLRPAQSSIALSRPG